MVPAVANCALARGAAREAAQQLGVTKQEMNTCERLLLNCMRERDA